MPSPLKSPELARKAKERLPGVSVLFTSGYTENAIVHGGRLDIGRLIGGSRSHGCARFQGFWEVGWIKPRRDMRPIAK